MKAKKSSPDQGIRIDIIGDSGPFSEIGKSIGYRINVKGSEYLIDCGAPPFQHLGLDGISHLKGLFITHSHEDHKRWLTDLALFRYYESQHTRRLPVITTETVHEELYKTSKAALERSLSIDSKRIIDIPYEDFIEPIIIGPKSKYKIQYYFLLPGERRKDCRIIDPRGREIGPKKAKVFVNPKANRPRMLFKDEETGFWVDPESYYSFKQNAFYEEDQNIYVDEEAGLKVRAIKSSAWHGPPNISLEITTDKERLFFSSDTAYGLDLWKELATRTHSQKLGMTKQKFEKSGIIYGDINDYLELTWSKQRYQEALSAYEGGLIIHDVAGKNSVVHTDYEKIATLPLERLILTHAPDKFVSTCPLVRPGKSYRVIENEFFEEVHGYLYRLEADVYAKEMLDGFVGFRFKEGNHRVKRQEDGLLEIIPKGASTKDEIVMDVDLYCDINGEYYPILDAPDQEYNLRPDGKVEKVAYNHSGSKGLVVKGMRAELSKEAG